MRVKLVLLQNGQRTREIPVKSPEAIMGRGTGCDVRICAQEISRHHCRIQVRGEDVFIRDLGSANGTYVNGQMIGGKTPLHHGDRIQVGGLLFLVELPLPTASQPALEAVPLEDGDLRTKDVVVVDGIVLLNQDQRSTIHQVPPKAAPQTAPPRSPKLAAVKPAESLPFAELAGPDESIPFAELEEG